MTDDKEFQGWCGKRPDGSLMITTCAPDRVQALSFLAIHTAMHPSELIKSGWTVVRVVVKEHPND